jgi:hypothetical protein
VKAINLHEAFPIVRQRQPLVAPIAGADRVRVAAAGRCGIEAQLAFNAPYRGELESGNVAGEAVSVST